MKHLYPSAEVRVAEVDPEVVRVANQYLELDSSRIDIRIGDGRRVLSRDVTQYDLVVNDAFQGVRKIPFHLTTLEFNQLVHDRLAFDGIYMTNVRGDPGDSYLASSFVRTLSKTFPHIYAEKASGRNSRQSRKPTGRPFPSPRSRLPPLTKAWMSPPRIFEN